MTTLPQQLQHLQEMNFLAQFTVIPGLQKLFHYWYVSFPAKSRDAKFSITRTFGHKKTWHRIFRIPGFIFSYPSSQTNEKIRILRRQGKKEKPNSKTLIYEMLNSCIPN